MVCVCFFCAHKSRIYILGLRFPFRIYCLWLFRLVQCVVSQQSWELKVETSTLMAICTHLYQLTTHFRWARHSYLALTPPLSSCSPSFLFFFLCGTHCVYYVPKLFRSSFVFLCLQGREVGTLLLKQEHHCLQFFKLGFSWARGLTFIPPLWFCSSSLIS